MRLSAEHRSTIARNRMSPRHAAPPRPGTCPVSGMVASSRSTSAASLAISPSRHLAISPLGSVVSASGSSALSLGVALLPTSSSKSPAASNVPPSGSVRPRTTAPSASRRVMKKPTVAGFHARTRNICICRVEGADLSARSSGLSNGHAAAGLVSSWVSLSAGVCRSRVGRGRRLRLSATLNRHGFAAASLWVKLDEHMLKRWTTPRRDRALWMVAEHRPDRHSTMAAAKAVADQSGSGRRPCVGGFSRSTSTLARGPGPRSSCSRVMSWTGRSISRRLGRRADCERARRRGRGGDERFGSRRDHGRGARRFVAPGVRAGTARLCGPSGPGY